MAFVLPARFEKVIAEKTQAELDMRGITRDEFREWVTKRVIRAMEIAPQPGTPAPDFNLEILSPKGKRTGEYMSLSALHGKPVALIMASYT
ncbi:MAG: hypothetical protein O2912_01185 [Proteobacteria bacterium]|nr:hypothetical protein [Pseudomonadota bacterium]